MSGLAFEGVRKDYGRVAALRGLDLAVAEGEFLVLVGPSGCGKTTALRVAAGLEPVTDGTIRIAGRDVTALPPGKRNVSMVFQSYALFPHLTAGENIAFGLRARGERDGAEAKVREAAALVGCETLLDRRPGQLSGGERQRVALARALVRHPDVFLLDEPLSNLDARLRVEMRGELRALHARLPTPMLYVTHDQVEALTMGERVAVLDEGRLQQVGTPDDVYRRPANRFVATFIGSPEMNLFPVTADGAGWRAGPFEVAIPPEVRERSLEAGTRPEHLRIDDGGIPADVVAVEVAGNETYVHLRADGARFVLRAAADVRPAVGSTVRVRATRFHLFDATTGEALEHPA